MIMRLEQEMNDNIKAQQFDKHFGEMLKQVFDRATQDRTPEQKAVLEKHFFPELKNERKH
jgi:hypothetical protein